MKRILMTLTCITIAAACMAQSALQGTWNGVLKVPGGSLTLVFHIDPSSPAIDSPDQSAYGIPAEIKELTSSKAHVAVPSLGAEFEGNFMFGLLVGTFRQSGMEFPLSLKRGDLVRNRPQTPSGPFSYISEEVEFTNPDDGAILSGTLTYPSEMTGNTPVILLASGSGLQDRNEEIYSHKPFLVIADHLAKNGIACLRYDDRSVGKSTGSASGATTATFLKDAEAGLEFLRNLGKFSKIGLAGHSEGGTIAFLLAGEGKTDFIISLAGAAIRGADVLIEQNKVLMQAQGVPSDIVNTYCNVLEKLYSEPDMGSDRLDEISESLPASMKQNLHAIREMDDPWISYFITLDPSETIKAITCPVFALNGEKDVQVIAESNIGSLRELLKDSDNVKLKTYPGLNHLFQHCTTGLPDEYMKIEETISTEVLNDITDWIKTL